MALAIGSLMFFFICVTVIFLEWIILTSSMYFVEYLLVVHNFTFLFYEHSSICHNGERNNKKSIN